MGIIQSCLLIGILGSRVFSGFLADVWGWRSVYFVACVFMLGCFLMIYKMLPVLSARSQESYAGLMKSLLRLLSQYPYLRIASLRAAESGIGLWLVLRIVELPCFPNEARTFLCERRYYRGTRFVRIGRCIYGCIH